MTKDVKDYALVVGNPAKRVGWISESGVKLNKDLICPQTKQEYKLKNNRLVKINEKNKIYRFGKPKR